MKVISAMTQADRLFLARHDSDPFNRWQALQDVAMALMLGAVGGTAWSAADVGALADAFEDTLASSTLDPAFKALALTLPGEDLVARTIGRNIDPDKIRATRLRLLGELVTDLEPALVAAYERHRSDAPYAPDAEQAGRRALKNQALALLVAGGTASGATLAHKQYRDAANMTDRFARTCGGGLGVDGRGRRDARTIPRCVFGRSPGARQMAGAECADRTRWGDRASVAAILGDPAFPSNNPNRLRALLGSFANGNPTQFARADGAGFRFITEDRERTGRA